MVALSDVQKVSLLVGEKERIGAALAQFAADPPGRIIAMTIGQPPPAGAAVIMPGGVTVGTAEMSYPQSMTDTIKQLLQQRQQAIETELQQLGVTGVGS